MIDDPELARFYAEAEDVTRSLPDDADEHAKVRALGELMMIEFRAMSFFHHRTMDHLLRRGAK